MTCKCGSDRIAQIHGKCSDMSSVCIDHLGFEQDGYVMDLGVGSGDYIEFDLCLDCGHVQGFKPITDEDIKKTDEWIEQHPEDDPDYEPDDQPEPPEHPGPLNEKAIVAREPDVFSMKLVEKQRIQKLMSDAYGPLWSTVAEAREILANTLEQPNCGAALSAAIKELL